MPHLPEGLDRVDRRTLAAALERTGGKTDRLRVVDGGRAVVIVNRPDLPAPAPKRRAR